MKITEILGRIFGRRTDDVLELGALYLAADQLIVGETVPVPTLRFRLGRKRFRVDAAGLTREA